MAKGECPGSVSQWHYVDNQGSCHMCGYPMDKYWWELYAGPTSDQEWQGRIEAWNVKHPENVNAQE